jgi:hypothetical protein
MRSGHLTGPCHREVDEIDIAPPWKVHLTVLPLDLPWQRLGCQGEEPFRELTILFADLSVDLVGSPKRLSLSGFLEGSLDGLAHEGAAGETGFFRQPVDLSDKWFRQT